MRQEGDSRKEVSEERRVFFIIMLRPTHQLVLSSSSFQLRRSSFDQFEGTLLGQCDADLI
jgi:hypothetical protein